MCLSKKTIGLFFLWSRLVPKTESGFSQRPRLLKLFFVPGSLIWRGKLDVTFSCRITFIFSVHLEISRPFPNSLDESVEIRSFKEMAGACQSADMANRFLGSATQGRGALWQAVGIREAKPCSRWVMQWPRQMAMAGGTQYFGMVMKEVLTSRTLQRRRELMENHAFGVNPLLEGSACQNRNRRKT